MSPEEKRYLELMIYALIYFFIFLLIMPVLIKFMNYPWSKWTYIGFALLGVFLMIRLRVFAAHLK